MGTIHVLGTCAEHQSLRQHLDSFNTVLVEVSPAAGFRSCCCACTGLSWGRNRPAATMTEVCKPCNGRRASPLFPLQMVYAPYTIDVFVWGTNCTWFLTARRTLVSAATPRTAVCVCVYHCLAPGLAKWVLAFVCRPKWQVLSRTGPLIVRSNFMTNKPVRWRDCKYLACPLFHQYYMALSSSWVDCLGNLYVL